MLITNIGRLVTMEPAKGREGPLGVIKDACVDIEDGFIVSVAKQTSACDRAITLPPKVVRTTHDGARSDGATAPSDLAPSWVVDARGGVVIPGIIDCHTHLVHAGDRSNEFAARARGASYEEIAKSGGGIMSTVRATRAASENELFKLSKTRALEALSHGITTIEAKSGYGLDLDNELKILRVIERLGKELPLEFIPTFLGAHTIPIEYLPKGKDGREKYIDLIVEEMIPAVARENLAKFCDVFVEKIAFTKEEGAVILKAARKHGLKLKVHADQLSSSGGTLLAADLKAVSADHLEYLGMKSLLAMKKAKVVPVLIPTSTFFVGGKYAAARTMIKEGLSPAISTDYNPGTSPILNIWLAAAVAITQLKLTTEEAYKGITINAARALGMEKTHGSVSKGKMADLVVLDCKSEYEPLYRFDRSYVDKVIKKGNVIYEAPRSW